MRSTLIVLALLLLASPAWAQTISSRIQPIADGAGNPATALDGLPVEVMDGKLTATADIAQVGHNNIDLNAGDTGIGTQRVVEASAPSSAVVAGTVVQGVAATVVVARAGRRNFIIQNQDADGALCVSRSAGTGGGVACNQCVLLGAANAAGEAGGSWEFRDYGGPIAFCAPDAGTTISYYYEEIY